MLQSDELAEPPDPALEAFLAASEEEGGGGFRMGPFLVGPDGFLQPASVQVSPRFSVRWRKLTVRATIAANQAAGGAGQLLVEIVTGRVPSTASCAGTDRRAQTFALLQSLPGKLPRGWRLHLLPDHHYGFTTTCPLSMPTSAAEMLNALTSFLLDLDPYLDALEAAGFGLTESSGGGAAGTAKT